MPLFSLKLIDQTINIDEFDCGNEDINYFLKHLALSNQNKKLSNTYILLIEDTNKAGAFFSLSASQLNTGDARVFGIDKIPIVLLGRLGVDKDLKGKNLGKSLIRVALKKALEASEIIACRLLLVETSIEMKSYYLEKLDLGFEWYRDKKNFSILLIDLLKYENSHIS